jgi:hypothetical protein
MDPLTIGGVVAALVASAAASAGASAGSKLTDAAGAAVGKVVAAVRKRFASDEAAEQALAKAEEVPDSPSRLGDLADAVDRHAADADWRAELQKLLDEVKEAGVTVGDISQSAWGDRNVQSAGNLGSSINVSYGQEPTSG